VKGVYASLDERNDNVLQQIRSRYSLAGYSESVIWVSYSTFLLTFY